MCGLSVQDCETEAAAVDSAPRRRRRAHNPAQPLLSQHQPRGQVARQSSTPVPVLCASRAARCASGGGALNAPCSARTAAERIPAAARLAAATAAPDLGSKVSVTALAPLRAPPGPPRASPRRATHLPSALSSPMVPETLLDATEAVARTLTQHRRAAACGRARRRAACCSCIVCLSRLGVPGSADESRRQPGVSGFAPGTGTAPVHLRRGRGSAQRSGRLAAALERVECFSRRSRRPVLFAASQPPLSPLQQEWCVTQVLMQQRQVDRTLVSCGEA